MSYSHTFYSLDIRDLMALHGSDNFTLLNEILEAQATEIRENDAFFEGSIENGDVPTTATAIEEIFTDNIREVADGALYAYALNIICQHVGEQIEGPSGVVAAVEDHPYESFLLKLGSPIPISKPRDFPEIGHLKFGHLDAELSIANQCKDRPTNSMEDMTYGDALNLLSMYMKPAAIYDEDIKADVFAYIETLELAKSLGKGIISFRH